MSIIDRIITTARQKGYTQVALADALKEHHVTKQTITDWKAGKSGTYFMLIPEFAALLDVSADYLLTGKNGACGRRKAAKRFSSFGRCR